MGRLAAAELIEAAASDREVARRFPSDADVGEPVVAGVSRWRAGGAGIEGARRRALQAHPAQLREPQTVLDAGPASWGWDEDQCWTLARIAELVRRRFGVGYTLAELDLLLRRIGWSVQVPARPAAERNEEAVARWREETWPVVKNGGGPGRQALLRRRVRPEL